jgi:hypothetical protein
MPLAGSQDATIESALNFAEIRRKPIHNALDCSVLHVCACKHPEVGRYGTCMQADLSRQVHTHIQHTHVSVELERR